MRKVKTGVYLGVFLMVLFVLNVAHISAQTGAGTANFRLREAMDIDGNGRADFTVFRASEKNWYTYKSGCSSNCTSVYNFTQSNPDNDIISPGDFDGDGKGDISVWRRTTGEWHRINSTNGNYVVTAWGTEGDEPVARDYDGDGKTDLAVVRRTGGQMTWYIWGSSVGYFGAQWGLPTDFVAPGDYDGDGKFDITVQRIGPLTTSPTTFYTLKSSNGGVETINWGAGDDRVVPGDYDDDGITDYAVVREWDKSNPNLVWNIRKSSNASQLLISYGATCTNAVPPNYFVACDANLTQNDYDGDGATDISVWRTSSSNTSTFFYLTSSSNFQTSAQFQWGVSADYPIGSYDSH